MTNRQTVVTGLLAANLVLADGLAIVAASSGLMAPPCST